MRELTEIILEIQDLQEKEEIELYFAKYKTLHILKLEKDLFWVDVMMNRKDYKTSINLSKKIMKLSDIVHMIGGDVHDLENDNLSKK